MGCNSSKVDDLPVVAFCRERRDLISAAADHRFALASCHESYFRALNGVGESLHRFVQEELAVVPTPSLSSSGTPSSPVLTIPSSEGKAPRSKAESPVAAFSGAVAGGGGSSSSQPSLSHSLSPEGSHLHLSSDSDSEDFAEEEGSDGKPYPYFFPNVPYPNYHYMRHSSAIPEMVYQVPYTGYGYAVPYSPSDGYYDAPLSSAPAGDSSSHFYYGSQMASQAPPAAPQELPPPPPAPEGSTWDFINPFQSYVPIYSSYILGSTTSSPNSSEVREQEGIPDLEEETETEPINEPIKVKKMVGDNASKDPGPSSSKSAWTHEKDVIHSEDTGSRSSSQDSNLTSSGGSSTNRGSGNSNASKRFRKGSKTRSRRDETQQKDNVEDTRKKEMNFELETSFSTERSGPTLETALSKDGTRNVNEATKEIKEQFKLAATSGSDVSAMLEIDKLHYHPSSTMVQVIFSRILDSFLILMNSCHLSKEVRHSTIDSYKNSENLLNSKSGNLSSTLERLSVWEKKLYKEVKNEEKLRIIYEKQCKRLRSLDNMGAESDKIDATRVSIRKLLLRIDVTIKSIGVISSRIHKLRDEELQPQLIELLHRLHRMWKYILECHQKQFLAIVESKSRNLKAKTSTQRGSVAKLSEELEVELMNWSSSFTSWINIQKVYFRTLNEWLKMYLHTETEETPDGVPPYSPGKMGAPSTFIICNDWCEAMEKVSEDQVSRAVEDFAKAVHSLRLSQDEEERQKLKADYLSRDLAGRLRSLHNETGLSVVQDGLGSTAASLPQNASTAFDGRMVAIESIRKRLEEEKAKHEEIIKQINATAPSSLRRGLVPVFHALGSYSTESIRAYEKIRIPGRARA